MKYHFSTTAFLSYLMLHAVLAQADTPRAIDDQLTVELFAEHPQIVTPTGLAVDSQGRVFVAESHTHFRPDDYDGPKADRILIFEDADGDGRAEKRTIFHEGFVHVMDIDFHRDGALYVATRKDIHRLRDTDNDGRADEVTPIVRLETKGNYPHNGLSGIAFDFRGGFHFGLGENLGEPYTLIGADGAQVSGGGEGGSTYHVGDLGNDLRRVSTGWWNPYGMCTDSFRRVFGTDNDPDSSPPCRLIQIVQDGDYGYEFRYGRSGLNPLVTWDGEIPGTLPMIAGTGEAPCHIVAYESDAFPAEYFGNLLVPSWADHRVERYPLAQRPDRGLVETERQTLIEGPDDFRPVGIDVAPDGTVYVSDWVSSSYTLHKLGRIWRIRPQELVKRPALLTDEQRLLSRDRRVRERAADELAKTAAGQATLRQQARSAELAQARATALVASVRSGDSVDVKPFVLDAACPLEARILAASLIQDNELWKDETLPAPLRAALMQQNSAARLHDFLILMRAAETEPWQQNAAIGLMTRSLASGEDWRAPFIKNLPNNQLGSLLALKRAKSTQEERQLAVSLCLKSKNPTIRFVAVKWAADESMTTLRPQLTSLLDATDLDLRTYLAIHVALDRLDGKPVTDRPSPDQLATKILDEKASVALRRLCLRLIDPNTPKLEFQTLVGLLTHRDEELQLEALRALSRHADKRKFEILLSVAVDPKRSNALRAEAIAGLAQNPEPYVDKLLSIASQDNQPLSDESMRALIGIPLTEPQRATFKRFNLNDTNVVEAAARILDQKSPDRPRAEDTSQWLKLVNKNLGNAEAGERIFFGTRVAKCSTCHQVEGLGAAVGPDLSTMSRRVAAAGENGKRWLLETILEPSRDMAPQFTPWQIVTKDGKQHIGLPRRKGGNSEAYLGTDGREFSLKNDQIESRHEASVSVMPADLLQQLTQQELADLFAFLTKPR